MVIESKAVIPWGRSFEEYAQMFNLSETDLSQRIIGCGDGPASFNKGMKDRGYQVVSCDPVYNLSKAQIANRIWETQNEVRRRVRQNPDHDHWTGVSSPDALIALRTAVMDEFLADYESGTAEGRYLPYGLPHFPFGDGEFALALCSHFLFLFSSLGYNFHLAAVLEMTRVARETRIFPLVDIDSAPSAWLGPVMRELARRGYQAEICDVPYHLQRNANQMLRIQTN